jgi:hypothetical protein
MRIEQPRELERTLGGVGLHLNTGTPVHFIPDNHTLL